MASSSEKMDSKDLITTGVFCVLFFIATMVGGVMFAPNPVLTFFTPVAVAIFTGPIYMLLIQKVPKRGPMIILGVIMGSMLFLTGMFWIWAIACVVLGFVSGEIARVGNFKSLKLNTVAFMVYSLNPISSYVMLWLDKQSYVDYLVGKGTEAQYMEVMVQHAYGWVLPAMIIGTLLASYISASLGKKLVKKQFAKAGVV
ncbi:MptD family putative ECF transporter S component [Clostridium sp. MSJ-4]|uniref:MptD family putative ECF transporter S component n=1 Tax=Clostridium simiarum TaxID=2841506 RepID=A0ABS6F3F8_9CLOT|nr:MptD family putative ECF transporter S component [Clostridium simiarum]MBU5593025.1 MptD family putative ECF transporter S component [Clostridium simiarum]